MVVGKTIKSRAHNKYVYYNYTDIPGYPENWIKPAEYLPKSYDLCVMRIKDKEKLYRGWHTGTCWDGLKLKEDDQVIEWKRIKDE